MFVVLLGGSLLGGCASTTIDKVRPPAAEPSPSEVSAEPKSDSIRAVEIALAYERSCARMSDGSVKCWGLGLDDVARSWPTRIDGLANVLQIALSSTHACARVEGGRLRCWGRNEGGALGDGTHKDARFPTADPGLDAIEQVVVGTDSTCALKSGGALCWGDNRLGTLGLGAASEEELRPALVPTLAGVRSLSLAGRHGLAVLPDGGVACFGDALCGASPAKVPTRIPALGHVVDVAVARQHACAILEH
ncbi:MAG: RCC1 domain-containing protein, partial [Polyangiales bacterium]